MKKSLLFCAALAVATLPSLADGEVRFARVIGDNMVLQRDVAAPVWGWADPGATVTVSLNGKCVGTTTAGEDGRWQVKLPEQKANKRPSVLTAESGGGKHSITNILFGDVFFGCGQSNMAYTFNGYGRLPVGGEEFIQKAAGNPYIRTLLMNDGENKNSPNARFDALPPVRWETSTPEAIRRNGAALYYMGYTLNKELDVPIGLVNASWGATKIDGWIDALWTKDNGTGYARGISNHWFGRWDGFIKRGGAEAYEREIKEWNKRFNPGENCLPQLHEPDFDDSSWYDIEPSENGFQVAPFPEGFKGDVWLRAVFELTEEDLKKNWAIGYHESYGQDMTFLNGHAFGGSGNPNHGYGVPVGKFGRVGKNVLAIQYKVHNPKNGDKAGGMHQPLRLSLWPKDGQTIPLKLKGIFGEVMPHDIWNHPECRKPDDARSITMFSATTMHNGLVQPLYPMALKACVWYQGCSDLGNGKYENLFENLIAAWRAQFTYRDRLPVIITEIAPHQLDTKPNSQGRIDAGDTKKPTWSVNADMRRQLNELGSKFPDCGTVSLLDLGEKDIHPIRKQEVGERYAAWALEHIYGRKIAGTCPTVESVEWRGPKAILKLKDAKGLKTSDGEPVCGFELAGPVHLGKDAGGKEKEGVKLYYADAKIVGDTIELSHPEVKEAFAFRYAWFDLNLGWNVVNGAGLPLGTCRGYKDGNWHPEIED